MVVWCPDWPVVAALAEAADPPGAQEPVAVVAAGAVHACSPAARAAGVRRGQRRRDAQARCPRLAVVDHDEARDVRVFEPVADAVQELAAGVEVLRPGCCALAARGPAGYFGGEAAAAELIVDRLAAACGVEAQVGVADGTFAAGLAARAGVLVPPGSTADFLAGMDVRVLGRPRLGGLLRRLGIGTLGAFAALPAGDVLARFGPDGALAHRLAGGGVERGLAPRAVPPDLTVGERFDPPVARVDAAAFAARALAGRLHERLAAHGVAATRLVIEAVTAAGEQRRRTWRHDGMLSAGDVADRVRWQLEGWLTGADAPSAGIVSLRLVPDGIVAHAGLQATVIGAADTGGAAARSATHVQGLLGADSIRTPVVGGGRDPAERVRWVAWGDERRPALPDAAPWPGALPVPAPAAVPDEPVPAEVHDADGAPVGVTGRYAVTAAPAAVSVSGAPPVEVVGWAGPWPVEERWWVPQRARRLARLQVALADGRALLLARRSGRWWMEADYD